jgi:3-carboxy-cis,cis-muconate cycloisomerase
VSHPFHSFLGTPASIAAFSENAILSHMLAFEAALAQAQAEYGLIPRVAAATIAEHCKVERYDVPALVAQSQRAGSVAIPLVNALRAMCGPVAADVHKFATSQDVIDTAMACATREVWRLIDTELSTLIAALLMRAAQHAASPLLARTLMQPAAPTTVGFKLVTWATPLVRSQRRLRALASDALAVQWGGAAGTAGATTPHAAAITQHMAHTLRLSAPDTCWHVARDAWIALGCEVGVLVGALGKIAKDISLHAQAEVAEFAEPDEPGRGGSSAMPHKRNPVGAMVALAAAYRAPQQVATLLATLPHEHERALGAWQAELATWPDLWITAHASVSAMASTCAGLAVNAARARQNLEIYAGVIYTGELDALCAPIAAATRQRCKVLASAD